MSRRRQISVLSALILYWPAIFIATHIPQVPRWVGQLPVSDKTMHFLAYFLLVFLLWFAINPNRKVQWNKPAVWWILFAVVWYGVIDEWLQIYVGRSADVRDFIADLAGTLTGLGLLTVFHFWPACLIVVGCGISIMTNILRAGPTTQLDSFGYTFHFCSYALLSILWMRYIHHFLGPKPPETRWLISAISVPIGLLLALEIFCLIAGYRPSYQATITSLTGAISAVIAVLLYSLAKKQKVNSAC